MIETLMPDSSTVEQLTINGKLKGSQPSPAVIAVPGSAVDVMCAIEGIS